MQPSFLGFLDSPGGGGTPKNPFLTPVLLKKSVLAKKIFSNKFFFEKKSFFGQISTFLGSLGGADEFFGVPRPPLGWRNSEKSVFTPYTP